MISILLKQEVQQLFKWSFCNCVALKALNILWILRAAMTLLLFFDIYFPVQVTPL